MLGYRVLSNIWIENWWINTKHENVGYCRVLWYVSDYPDDGGCEGLDGGAYDTDEGKYVYKTLVEKNVREEIP